MAIALPSFTQSPATFSNDDSFDPLTASIAPPPNETSAERAIREQEEKAAIQRSKEIDLELKAAKVAMKKYKNAVKILVLGQSMSGKSTTIKNFQISYAQKSWSEERMSWKAIILLNLVRSVNIIVDALSTSGSLSVSADDEYTISMENIDRTATIPTEEHTNRALRLTPLRQIEKDLKNFLGSGACEIELSQGYISDDGRLKDVAKKRVVSEFCLRSSSGWKSIFDQIRIPHKQSTAYRVACSVVMGCKEDVQWLWNNSITRQILHQQHIRLEESPGFFLDDIDRIASLEYEPSDSDILRARLRTTGVQEYHFSLDRPNGPNLDWIMYDVAGIRTARAAWVPFFREVTALLFLAPLSSFNERLEEDSRTYRLEDTFSLWKSICSNKLLSNVQIILFLNKTDLLRKKLEQGIQLQRYIPEYDKPNDFVHVSSWFRRVFKKYYIQYSLPSRPFISHFTSVVDTQATAQTLETVQETILRNDVVQAGLM